MWKRFAVLSDIHGNSWALAAVLEDMERCGIEKAVNLGDSLYGPLDPAGTSVVLGRKCFPSVRGNEDYLIADTSAHLSKTLRYVRNELSPEQVSSLKDLPVSLHIDDIMMFHGTPESDTTYLLWDVGEEVSSRRTAHRVLELLGHNDSTLVLCGHDHTPGTLSIGSDCLIVNPGSVGLQAYDDETPHYHVMETLSPHARYCIMEKTDEGWAAEFRTVAYDWESASRAADANGRPDWAEWLRTGKT